jgi:diketogulonate reductase-like aldo/keto reductase
MPPQSPGQDCSYLDGVERLAAAVGADEPARARASARRSAHVVAVCDGIQRAATGDGPVAVADYGATAEPVPAPVVRPAGPDSRPDGTQSRSLRLPRIGFGCSRYRGDEYVDRVDAIETALDAGYRLLDSAELYGNEHRIGGLLAAPGAPDRDALFVLGKVWRTNHDHVVEACAGSCEELGVDAFDCYTLHWPEAWAYQGSLRRLAEKPVDEREALTFPRTDGDIETADVSLVEAWANLETVYDRGWARTLGLCNVSRAQIERVLDAGRVRPSVVQVERHPYQPRHDLVEFCHDRGIRVIAHSPLSAPGLLSEPVLESIAGERGLSPAGVVVAWNATDGVVPIPASNDREHIVENLAAAGEVLSDEECERIAALADPDFER